MLEVVVGVAAAILVLAGVAIALGPVLPRRLRALRALIARLREDRAAVARDAGAAAGPRLHPTTQRAVYAAARIASLLAANGKPRQAAEVRSAARQVTVHEVEGLRALRRVELDLQLVRLEDEGAYLRFRQLQKELRQHVGERAEQLELLFR